MITSEIIKFGQYAHIGNSNMAALGYGGNCKIDMDNDEAVLSYTLSNGKLVGIKCGGKITENRTLTNICDVAIKRFCFAIKNIVE